MAQGTPPQLTPAALFEDQFRMDSLRLDIYNRILSTVQHKIRYTSTLPGSPQMTYFDVPEWQPGCPRFDVKDCILYIVWNLRHSGFQVMYVSPNRLLISWKEQSIQYYQQESPIRQAMMATAAGGAGTSTSSRTAATAATASGKPEKKKASAYKPATENIAGMLATGRSSSSAATNTLTFI